MNEEQIKQYYERIEKLLNGANKKTYGFVPEEIKQILKWYEHLQRESKRLEDNWNSLKESLKFDIELYDTLLLHRKMTSDKVLKEMEELERGGINE